MKILFLMTYQMKENFIKINIMLSKRYVKPTWKSFTQHKDGVTISLQMGGQGQPTPIHTQHPIQPLSQHRNIHKKVLKR